VSTATKDLQQTNTQKQDVAQKHARIGCPQGSHSYAKIKSIKYIGKQDVYNMEVKDHHNFSVNGGLIVHNSIDGTRYALENDFGKKTVRGYNFGGDKLTRKSPHRI